MLVRAGIVVALLVAPSLALAGYNDVNLQSGTTLSVNGVTINAVGASTLLQSIVVSSGSFDVTLLPNSVLEINVPNLNKLTVANAGSVVVTNTCTGDFSKLVLSLTGGGSTTVTVTPTSTICATAAASTGGGGGGGGGGANPIPAPVATSTTTTTTTPPAPPAFAAAALSASQVQAILGLLTSFNADATTIAKVQAALEGKVPPGLLVCAFKRDLTLGSKGTDVTCLQNWLIAKGHSIPAGATGYFGKQTQATVAAWQKAAGVTPAAGYFGAKSRAAIGS